MNMYSTIAYRHLHVRCHPFARIEKDSQTIADNHQQVKHLLVLVQAEHVADLSHS